MKHNNSQSNSPISSSVSPPDRAALDKEKVLEQRARKLACVRTDPHLGWSSLDRYITFSLSELNYAFPIEYVLEIRHLVSITMVPNLPTFFLGIINVRGTIVLVFQLDLFLEFEHKTDPPSSKIIIVKHEKVVRGILAHNVEKKEVQPELNELPEIMRTERASRYLIGQTHDHECVLNVPAILSDPSILLTSISY
ncbi:chemotaxis protein CheW [bacterium]|nr:chemotaxis protein CheW [bacterium]